MIKCFWLVAGCWFSCFHASVRPILNKECGKVETKSFFADKRGYTFVELMVVIVLIGVMLTLTVPRLRETLLTDTLKRSARKMVGTIKFLRNEAVREHRPYVLYFDMESGKFWADSPDMTEEERIKAKKLAFSFPKEVHIMDVWLKGEGKKGNGEAQIIFNKRGYVRQSAIHMGSEDGRKYTIVLNPFLGRVQVLEEYVEFVDS
jgi:prepilin-type N-terminal cleavage/methylation domain-containing protein